MNIEISETAGPSLSSSEPELAPSPLHISQPLNAAVIVAHPDDETLWAGGMILTHPEYNWFIATLCRKSDPDRSPRFFNVLQSYGARGAMADMDDGPEQIPLAIQDVQKTLLEMLPPLSFELVLTHAPTGEYTRHLRHEEVSQAIMDLWQARGISAKELWLFAYEDDEGRTFPHAIENAHQFERLPEAVCREKYRLITEVYGFSPESWEAKAMPEREAFWCFKLPSTLQTWLERTREHK